MRDVVRRRARALAVPFLLLGAATVATAGPVSSAPSVVKCGSTITQNTTLTANIGPCASGGLKIGADNITLDLGGFAILGKTNRTGDGVGVLLSGRSGVTVDGPGRIVGFDAGVGIVGGSGNTVQGLLIKDNIGTTKRGDFGDGVAVSGSDNNSILDNNVIHNGPFSGVSLVGDSDGNLVDGNVVSENNIGATGDDGIRIEGPGANNNVVSGNTVTGNTLDGIAIFSDQVTGNLNTGNTVDGNTVTANGFGILAARPGDGIRTFLRANQNTIQNNEVHDNAGSGILIANGSLNNSILTNTSTGNARQAAPSSPRYDLQDLNVGGTCDNNLWSGNTYVTADPACTTV